MLEVVAETGLEDAMTAVAMAEHPAFPVTVTVYIPAGTPVIESVLLLLLHAYVNGPVPVLMETLAEPFEEPQVVLPDAGDRVMAPPVELTIALPVAEQLPVPDTVTV